MEFHIAEYYTLSNVLCMMCRKVEMSMRQSLHIGVSPADLRLPSDEETAKGTYTFVHGVKISLVPKPRETRPGYKAR